jgi:hypothetical protein
MNPPLTFLAVLLGSSPTWTCPLRRSETVERVRAGIFDGAFGSHLLVVLLPFPVLLGIIALIHVRTASGRTGAASQASTLPEGPPARAPLNDLLG